MGIRTVTYLDLSSEQRREAAKVARERLRAISASPLLTAEQSRLLAEKVALLDQWEVGSLKVSRIDPTRIPGPAPKPTPNEQETGTQGGSDDDV